MTTTVTMTIQVKINLPGKRDFMDAEDSAFAIVAETLAEKAAVAHVRLIRADNVFTPTR